MFEKLHLTAGFDRRHASFHPDIDRESDLLYLSSHRVSAVSLGEQFPDVAGRTSLYSASILHPMSFTA